LDSRKGETKKKKTKSGKKKTINANHKKPRVVFKKRGEGRNHERERRMGKKGKKKTNRGDHCWSCSGKDRHGRM